MDDLLRTFVKAANEHDFSLDITLNIGGALVTGKTVSAEKYLDAISESFKEGNDVSKAIGEKLEKASEAAKDSNGDVQFIHLQKTQIYNGNEQPVPSEESFYWRGRLDAVEGFFLGKID